MELKLHGIGDAGSLWKGVQGIGEAGRERSELTLYLQVAGRVVGGDLEALFASSGNRADLLASSGAPSLGYLLFSFVGKPGIQHIGT